MTDTASNQPVYDGGYEALDLDALEAFAKAATTGPWTCDEKRPRWITTTGEIEIDEADWGQPDKCHLMKLVTVSDDRAWRYADVRHVAAFDPPTVLALIARIRELEDRVTRLNELAYNIEWEVDPVLPSTNTADSQTVVHTDRVDCEFFGSRTSEMLLAEFGGTGVTVWLAYLCACKRNLVPGQISVISDADTLAQLGLSGLDLLTPTGEPYTLETLWTRLGHTKQTRRRARGRVTDIVCTHWGEWQQASGRDVEAERKSRSRPENTRTKPGPTETQTETQTGTVTETQTGPGARPPPPTPPPRPVSLLPVGFDAFWDRWPEDARRKPREARKAWQHARGHGTPEHDILIGLDAWTRHWAADQTASRFIPNPDNWLRDQRWHEPPPAPRDRRPRGQQQTDQLQDVLVEFIAKGEP